jgi:hypothetical protein
MTRTFQDDELLLWETYPAAPPFGATRGARIMFQCLTDPSRRARALEHDGDRAGAAKVVAGASSEELLELLRSSEPLS